MSVSKRGKKKEKERKGRKFRTLSDRPHGGIAGDTLRVIESGNKRRERDVGGTPPIKWTLSERPYE